MIKQITTLALLSALFCGCSSIFMPYKDEFRCNKGIGEGTCSSMSENYKAIQENKIKKTDSNDESTTLKEKSADDVEKLNAASNTCKKCEDTTNAVWLKQRALEKKMEANGGSK